VRTGDTLWDIAARHLGPHATPQEIAHEWPRWWRSNASVVGRDPDVLRPGQVLTAPD
jgi:nucleoid-associated protein YgaU